MADFGLVRDGDSGLSQIREVTKTFCFTKYYYAPEVLDGDVSVKLDTFSFGVVLLELLTGLAPCHKDKPLVKVVLYFIWLNYFCILGVFIFVIILNTMCNYIFKMQRVSSKNNFGSIEHAQWTHYSAFHH